MKKLISLFLLVMAYAGVYATITGPALVVAGSTGTYTYSGTSVSSPNWLVTGGSVTSSTSTTVTILWSSGYTSGTISYRSATTQVDGYGVTFVTTPTASAATNITAISFNANWAPNGPVASYQLDVSTSSTFSSFVTGYNNLSVSTTSATVTGLSGTTTYYYRVRSLGNIGVTGNSTTITVTTSSASTPTAPTNVSTSIASNNSIKITWTDNSTNEASFEVDRSIGNNTNYAKIATLTANNVQYVDINLTPGVIYYYRVRAANGTVYSAYATGASRTITKATAYTSATTTKNYVMSTGYGDNGTVTGQAIAFSDNLGRSTQAVTRSINDGRVLTAQSYYDNYGRPIISTLSVPVAQTNLNYVASLATKSGTTTDLEALALTETTVKDLAINAASPLGVYYSSASMEGFMPEDTYPYTAVQYSKTQPGSVRKSTLAGKDHRLGQAHEMQTYTMPVTRKELERFTTNDLIDTGIELDGLIKSISIDPDGKEGITYSASDGKLISSCLSNSANAADLKIVTFSIDAATSSFYYDLHIPKGCDNTLKVYSTNGSTYKFSIVDLSTDNVLTAFNNITIGSSSTARTIAPGVYRLVFQKPAAGTYTVNLEYKLKYYNHSLNVYDKAGHLVKSFSPKAVAAKTTTMVTTYEYNSLGQLLTTTSPDEGRTEYKYRTDGRIRYSQNALQKANETAVNNNGYFSFTNYDAIGRIVSVGEYKSGSNRFASLTGMETLSGTLSQVTATEYDTKAASLPVAGYEQHFTCGKVSKTYNDNCTTWYSYTYDGNIEWVTQLYANFDTITIDYEYDFNGNVVRAIYQKNTFAERFDHEYVYDADNRLSLVFTRDYASDGKVNQQKQQARYIYYAHGPLKRVELADKLQGIDYVYTINGWLKSINNPKMVIAEDPGADGPSANQFGQDVFAMTLDYFYNDYVRTGTNKTIKSSAPSGTNMFGGLIYAQRWNTNQIDKTGTAPSSTHSMYKYDYTNENYLGKATFGTYNSTAFTAGTIYKVYGLNGTTEINIPYDANGNILNMAQNGSTAANLNMDKLAYNYSAGKNQLGYVTDAVTSDVYSDDLATQASGNYSYDVTGRMTGNLKDLQFFEYDVYGHVTRIYKNSAKTQILSEYFYDDKGFRIRKIDRRNTPATVTWYVRDAGGTMLAIYSAPEGITPVRSEVELYGASRLGTAQVVSGAITKFLFELTDHLGNVRAVITADGTDANTYPDLAAYTDFYPFGMSMPDRVWTSGLLSGAYRFGYQGLFAEKDPETGYNQFEARLYDSRIGRWMIPDPARQFWSPYLNVNNNPIQRIDPDGREMPWFVNKKDGSLKFIDDAIYNESMNPGSDWIKLGDNFFFGHQAYYDQMFRGESFALKPNEAMTFAQKYGYKLAPSSILSYEFNPWVSEFMPNGGATIEHEYWQTFTYAKENTIYWWKNTTNTSIKEFTNLEGWGFIQTGEVINYRPSLFERLVYFFNPVFDGAKNKSTGANSGGIHQYPYPISDPLRINKYF